MILVNNNNDKTKKTSPVVIALFLVVVLKACGGDYYSNPSSSSYSNASSSSNIENAVCRRTGCGRPAVYTDWNRRYCSEHIEDNHYCRYPGCMNQISNSNSSQYCSIHK